MNCPRGEAHVVGNREGSGQWSLQNEDPQSNSHKEMNPAKNHVTLEVDPSKTSAAPAHTLFAACERPWGTELS